MKDRAEVCPLAREVILQLLSVPLQDGLCFFRIPLPPVPSVRLAVSYPLSGELRAYRVPYQYPSGLGSLSSPVALHVHEGGEVIPPSRHSAFWLKPLSILGLFHLTTFSKRSHMLTIPLILAPYPP